VAIFNGIQSRILHAQMMEVGRLGDGHERKQFTLHELAGTDSPDQVESQSDSTWWESALTSEPALPPPSCRLDGKNVKTSTGFLM
jgi:hypothetical protein